MALSFRRFSWLWFKGKENDQAPNNSSVINPSIPLTELALTLRGDPETLRIPSMKKGSRKLPSSSSNTKRKWRSREEYNVVLVPSDGLGYESDDSDWSIGWLEPHAPEFTIDADDDDTADNSFAVLVPCYRHQELEENVQQVPRAEFLSAVKNLPNDDDSSGTKYHVERWLTSHY